MKDVKSLVDTIMSLCYRDEGDRFDFHVVSERHRGIVQGACAEWYAEAMTDQISLQAEIGRLQAMVTAYEAILRNSNFAMAVERSDQNDLS